MSPTTSISLVLALLGGLILGTYRLRLGAEASRKLVHIGMGSICLSFPWIFESAWPVDLLATLAIVSLVFLRWAKPAIGNVLHGVNRLSFGELLFPAAVAIVFRLTNGDLTSYLPAIAILTFADSAGALIGKRFGKHPYYTKAGQKSVEGSLAVFVVSFLITFACQSGGDFSTTLLISIVVALVAMMAEGILGAGIDNFILPITVYALLFFLRDLTPQELLARIGLMAAVATLLAGVRSHTTLNGGGLLSATVFGYLCYGLGGLPYLISPLVLFGIHLYYTHQHQELKSLTHQPDAVAAIAFPCLIWLALGRSNQVPEATACLGFCIVLAAQVALLHGITRAHLGRSPAHLEGAIKVFLVLILSQRSVDPLLIVALFAITFLFAGLGYLLRRLNRFEHSLISFLLSLPILAY